MLEVEMKFTGVRIRELEEELKARGARQVGAVDETDHYLNGPDRDFARTDEAFRLRRLGEDNFLTYKGPKTDRQTKTRTEIEVALAPGTQPAEAFLQMAALLGYRPSGIVKKQRKIYQFEEAGQQIQVCLDRVEGLGEFAELEILAPESQFETARQALLALAGKLALTASERRSYLELLLERTGNKP